MPRPTGSCLEVANFAETAAAALVGYDGVHRHLRLLASQSVVDAALLRDCPLM